MGHHPKGVNPVVGSRMWRVCCQERRRGGVGVHGWGLRSVEGLRAVEGLRSVQWKGYVRCSGRVTFARRLWLNEALVSANVQRGVSLPPLQSPLPANNLAAARFPRLHFLASGRPGYGILPLPPSAPPPCGADLARQLRLGDVDAGPGPVTVITVNDFLNRHYCHEGIPSFTGIARAWFCVGSGELLCPVEWLHSMWLKCYVRQAVVAQCGTGDRERAKGGIAPPLCNPRSRPVTSPLRGSLASISSLQVGRDTASCLSRPQAHIPVGLTWLVNYASAMLMPDTTPQLTFMCFE